MSVAFSHLGNFLCYVFMLTIPVPSDKFLLAQMPQQWGQEESCRCGESRNGYQQHSTHDKPDEWKEDTLQLKWRACRYGNY